LERLGFDAALQSFAIIHALLDAIAVTLPVPEVVALYSYRKR
jgi:hypothetical protein